MLKQKFLVDFGSKFITYLITAITGIVVARIAGPEVVGTIAYATAYVMTFSFFTGLFGSAHIKLVSEGQNQANCNKTYISLMIISIAVFFIVLSSVYIIQKYSFHYNFGGNEIEIVIFITLLSYILSLSYQINETLHNALILQVRSNLPSLLKNILYNLLRIIVVLIGLRAIGLASVNLLSAIIALPLVFYFMKRLDFGNWDKELGMKYFRIALPIFGVVVTNVILGYSDKLILEYYSSIKEVGYYSAAYSIGGMLILLGNTAGTLFFPLFSNYVSQNNFEAIKLKIKAFERFIFVFILPSIMVLSIYAQPVIITLLGTKYGPSVPLFSVLVLSSFFIIWSMPYNNILSSLGLFWLTSYLNFAKFIFFLITLIILISPSILNLGAMALALTALITNLFMFISYYYFSYRKMHINLLFQQIQYIAFWGILSPILFFIYAKYLVSIQLFLQLTIVAPITLIIIYLLHYLFGLMKKQDIYTLKQTISLNSAYLYLKHEIKDNSHNNSSYL